MFATTIALVKTSTLLLYKRIFVIKRFQVACYGMMALTAGWFLASVFVGASAITRLDPSDKDIETRDKYSRPRYLQQLGVQTPFSS